MCLFLTQHCFVFRELLEESGVTANSLSRVGLINFEFEKDPVILEVHIFKTSDYTGTPTETEGKKLYYVLLTFTATRGSNGPKSF